MSGRLRRRLDAFERRAISLVAFAILTLAAGVLSCAPPAVTPVPSIIARLDSMSDAEARAKGPMWRAAHFPALDPHGPFPRPELADHADSNDAMSYFRLGDSVKRSLPGVADRAFYWALRLDPTMADAYFARWSLLRRQVSWRELPDGTIKSINESDKEALAADSLFLAGLSHNPFAPGSFEVPPLILQIDARRAARDPVTAGMRAYATGDYRKAVAEWAKALRSQPRASMLHVPRAYAWVRLDETDSAIAELTVLADRIEAVQRDSLSMPYLSRDVLFYAIGMLHANKGRYAEARAAYEKALLENLGFYMAHVRLSAAAILMHDTTVALTELEMAKLIRADDPPVLVYHGSLLRNVGRLDDAERELHAALRANSDFALPHAFLGLIAESRHDTASARAAYDRYLARASRTALERSFVIDRLSKITPR